MPDTIILESGKAGRVPVKAYDNGDGTYSLGGGPRDVTVLASAARTATTNSADQINLDGQFLRLYINVSAIVTAPSITVTIQAKDPVSGTYSTILVSAAITAVDHTVLQVGPGLTAAANLVAQAAMPRSWRVSVTHANANSITYSIGASLS